MKKVSAKRLREVLIYDPLTGIFVWRLQLSRRVRAGRPAGTVHRRGYLSISIDGRHYPAHRLAWLYMRGCWPGGPVRARNDDLLDLRWVNLQVRTRKQAAQSEVRARKHSTTGVLGVSRTSDGKFRAQITADGRYRQLGRFEVLEAASAVYLEAKKRLHRA